MDSYEKNGIVQTYEDLEQKTSVGERVPADSKRVFIYNVDQYAFFLAINPHKRLVKNDVSGILNNNFIYR